MKKWVIPTTEIIATIVCILFGILWLQNPDGPYEPPFAVSSFVLVITELYRRYSKKSLKSNINKKDVELFEEFIALFSNNDLIRFYKEYDFLGSFDKKFIDPLYEFIEFWDNAAHEFIDEELENEKNNLYKAAYELGTTIARNTVPNRHGFISVKPDHLAGGPTPDWVINDAKEINALAPRFVELHEAFIRLGRKKLYG